MAGFAKVSAHKVYDKYVVPYWTRLFPFPKRMKRRLLTFLHHSPIGRTIIPFPAGNLAVIGYK